MEQVTKRFEHLITSAEIIIAKMVSGPIRRVNIEEASDYLFEARQLEEKANDITLSKRWQVADITLGQLTEAYKNGGGFMISLENVYIKEELESELPYTCVLDDIIGSDVTVSFYDDGAKYTISGKLGTCKEKTLSLVHRDGGEVSISILDYARIEWIDIRGASMPGVTEHIIKL